MATKQLSPDQIKEVFGQLDHAELLEMATSLTEMEKRLIEDGPRNDDELWLWVKTNLHIEIPRVAVCDDHDPPFKFLADAYFQRDPAYLVMANRGGAKTFLVALLHWLNSRFKPGIEGATFGATEAQSLRCYAHLKQWVYDDDGNRKPEIATSVMRETTWRSGSKVEVLAGTPEAVNGPHPQVVHADEVELMRQDTWDESRNMAVSKRTTDGKLYPSMEILTSTRKSLHGRMQSLIDGIKKAQKLGATPDYKLLIWCIFEVAAEVPNCRKAPKKKREARLKELGEDPCSLCDCNKHMKGEWPDTGKPRYLEAVCNGRLFRSRGWMPYSDVVQKFKQNSLMTWEAQQECRKPETEFNYLLGFAEEKHGLRGYEPKPELGMIFMSVDWGGTNPHAVNWYQLLDVDIEATDFYENKVRLIEGTLVCFDEIYKAEIGVDRLAQIVKEHEFKWRTKHKDFKVFARFADPQGKMARLDFKDAGMPTVWKTTRDFDEQVEWLVRDFWEPGLLRYSVENCPMFKAEAEVWQRDPKTGKQLDEFNHCMSNLRYATANIRSIRRRVKKGRTAPRAKGRHQSATVVRDTRQMVTGPMTVKNRGDAMDEWRARLGGPEFGPGR